MKKMPSGFQRLLRKLFKYPSEATAVFFPDLTNLAILQGDAVFMERLNCNGSALRNVRIQFATYQRTNHCLIDVRLLLHDGTLVHREAIFADSITDNAFHALKLPDAITADGLWIALSSPDADDRNHVAVWINQEVGSAILFTNRNGRPLSDLSPANSDVKYDNLALSIQTITEQSGLHYRRVPKYRIDAIPERTCTVAVIGEDEYMLNGVLGLCAAENMRPTMLPLEAPELPLGTEVLVFPADIPISKARMLCVLARRSCIPALAVHFDGSNSKLPDCGELAGYADGLITDKPIAQDRLPVFLTLGTPGEGIFGAALASYRKRRQPKVSIVTILHGKADQLVWVIQSYFSQTYSGEIEVVYVDDDDPLDCSGIVAEEFRKHQASHVGNPRVSHRIIRNERNSGNCESRNIGIRASVGDIVVVVDADCMLNRGFVDAHVDAHSYLDCEVVIGALNIETHGMPPAEKLAQLESNMSLAPAEAELQDKTNLESFLNCITRNFSIKRSALPEQLFDPHFGYSRTESSGFGWEDVEMGYRLYLRGYRAKFTSSAFSIHISHPSSIAECEKPAKSLRNFKKLFDKHPELALVARRWARRTFQELHDWSMRADPNHGNNADIQTLSIRFPFFGKERRLKKTRQLRILTYRWHVPHQYELYKTGHQFYLLTGLGSPMCESWELGQRPMPANARFISIEDMARMEFDLAILHFDENVLSDENTNGQLGPEWGATFRWFVENLDLPKVAVCHGTPQFHGQYTPGYDKPDLMQPIEAARLRLVEYVRDMEIVCNSHQAQKEWRFHRSRVIWHGFDPSEFPPATYERGILSPLGPLVTSRPHYRGYYLYQQVFNEQFPVEYSPSTLSVPEPDIDYSGNEYALAKYRNYVDHLRKYSVYFNPTLRSPMPRARAEPMMCGVVTVNAKNHDVDMFIKNGENGFYSNDPNELREQLLYLMRNPDAARRIGEESRKTALELFNLDRYLSDWQGLLYSLH